MFLQQGHHNTRMVAQALEQEWSQALVVKVVRRGKDTSARNWPGAIDKLIARLEENFSTEIAALAKVEAKVWLMARSEKTKQRHNDSLKAYVGKAADLQEALVILGRPSAPSLKTALS